MRILITGDLGQLGSVLKTVLAEHDLYTADLPDVDITDRPAIERAIRAAGPELVIHCAAYTDVDGCARDPALAYKVNGLGTQNVALACQSISAEMVHVSTNEVFAGDDPSGYDEWVSLNPVNAYGRSKAAAEVHVSRILRRYYIVRTAWLYGPGGRNFVHAILKRARNVGHLQVVVNEVGNPTYVWDLAQAIASIIATGQYGIYHFTNTGACSRWAFANEILKLAGLEHVPNRPILSSQFRRTSVPPTYGKLNNIAGAAIGITLQPWQQALAQYISEYERDPDS